MSRSILLALPGRVTAHFHVPDELASSPFLGSEAITRGLLTKNQLHGPTWVRLMRDVYVRRGLEADARMRVAALALRMRPDEVVCGRTAAWLHGVWSPPPGRPLPLDITRPVRGHGQQVRGVARRRLILGGTPDWSRKALGPPALTEDVVTMGELRVTSPLRTSFDLMRPRSLVEAVVVADAFADAGCLQLPVLAAYCADRRRWPGVRLAREAVELAAEGARSPGETRLRMIIVLAGFEEPLVNVPVQAPSGEHLGTPDLALRGKQWIHLEYDGAYHDEAAQHGRDLRRQNGLQILTGVPMLRFDWRHVLHQRQLVLSQVATASGERPRADLNERDFSRGPSSQWW